MGVFQVEDYSPGRSNGSHGESNEISISSAFTIFFRYASIKAACTHRALKEVDHTYKWNRVTNGGNSAEKFTSVLGIKAGFPNKIIHLEIGAVRNMLKSTSISAYNWFATFSGMVNF
ncbi:hypothetical protein RRG08_024726 [Elysia crispata]|uniref:Uncharacterized protein n=1 Tax=Elysia crispata TaxID=231223 RepID=A0AAE1CXI8_9GAST|nr:hypothetical protein RRG08_024726 [Elysia crispata]